MSRLRPSRRPLAAAIATLAFGTSLLASAQSVPEAAPGAQSRNAMASAAQKLWNGAQDVALFALGLIGVEYRFGGETPEGGLDCSGLVRHVFQQVTGFTLPRTAKEMSRVGAKVASSDLQVGDLVFFDTRHFAFSHVGIYLGDNRFVHAPSRGSEVEIAQLSDGYWQKHFNGARRLVGVLPALVPSALAATGEAPASAR